MPKFRTKPVVIEAIQWTGLNGEEIEAFTGTDNAEVNAGDGTLHIYTRKGTLHASVEDWIIKRVKGEFYSCKPDIFAATYEPSE